jgi:Rad3-related DNA helicase
MVFGKLKDEKDYMVEKMKRENVNYGDGEHLKFGEDGMEGILDEQHNEITFNEKLTIFISILEKSITESGDKAKSLNKLHDALSKTKIAYQHYSEKLGQLEDDTQMVYDFFMCIQDESPSSVNKRKIGIWCFNPSFTFKQLLAEKPRSVIFASGTLAPLNSYACEMETSFPIRVENDHVIDKNKQVMVGLLTKDIDQRPMNFSYKTREDSNFFIGLAHTLLRIFKSIKLGGILIFLPSYVVISKIKKVWRANKLFKEI